MKIHKNGRFPKRAFTGLAIIDIKSNIYSDATSISETILNPTCFFVLGLANSVVFSESLVPKLELELTVSDSLLKEFLKSICFIEFS